MFKRFFVFGEKIKIIISKDFKDLRKFEKNDYIDIETIVNDFLNNPTNYINNHSYGMTNEEYYEELKVS